MERSRHFFRQRALYAALIFTALVPFQCAQAATFALLYAFEKHPDGAAPFGGLVGDRKGNLYGTTSSGGNTSGTVFEIARGGTETVLGKFRDPSTGYGSTAALVSDRHGNFYGTNPYGGDGIDCGKGANGCGTVFELERNGRLKSLHEFTGGDDGIRPLAALLMDASGNLYGTTFAGGSTGTCGVIDLDGCGTVFRIAADGTESVLHAFGVNEGELPSSALIADSAGDLFGTTALFDGSFTGAIFTVTPTNGAESILYVFKGGRDGETPESGLIADAKGTFYGTTTAGGGSGCDGNGCGTIYSFSQAAGETMLHAFKGRSDGRFPAASLVIDGAGNLYGTTVYGGSTKDCGQGPAGCGTVFELATDGTEHVLHVFSGRSDGAYPWSNLFLKDGKLYGTASAGGASGKGTVFELTDLDR